MNDALNIRPSPIYPQMKSRCRIWQIFGVYGFESVVDGNEIRSSHFAERQMHRRGPQVALDLGTTGNLAGKTGLMAGCGEMLASQRQLLPNGPVSGIRVFAGAPDNVCIGHRGNSALNLPASEAHYQAGNLYWINHASISHADCIVCAFSLFDG